MFVTAIVTVVTSYLFLHHASAFYAGTHPSSIRTNIFMAKQTPQSQQQLNEKARKYIQMKELQKMRNDGRSYDDIKELMINGTAQNIGTDKIASKGYQKFVGKGGSLDQRLRAVVSYKRSSIASEALAGSGGSGLSTNEELELEAMMEDDEDFDSDGGEEDEEAEYERLIMKAIEKNKLDELQRNFLLDKASRNEARKEEQVNATSIVSNSALNNSNITEPEASSSSQDDDYVPARSSWGVFKRPKDISKTYGGGRVISREEMDRMDAEYEEIEKKKQTEVKQFMTKGAKMEQENADKIKKGLGEGRYYMAMGNRKNAVESLERIKDSVTWQTETGGEVLLELAMALETVDRVDEAREIYGKLASVSWSDKTRRNALQLIQGLDITKQIRSQVRQSKPAMDDWNMHLVEEGIRKGLTNEWDDFKKNKPKSKIERWYDDENSAQGKALEKVDTLRDAYYLLLRAMNPLKKVPSELLRRCLRKTYVVPETEKYQFLRSRGLVIPPPAPKKTEVVQSSLLTSSSTSATSSQTVPQTQPTLGNAGATAAETAFTSFTQQLLSDATPDYADAASSSTPAWKSALAKSEVEIAAAAAAAARISTVPDSFTQNINGTWEIVVSIFDKSPYTATRYEYGQLRRTLLAAPSFSPKQAIEVSPVFWGLSTTQCRFEIEWNKQRCELTARGGGELQRSAAPWHDKKSDQQVVQVTYCDEALMVCRQQSESVTGPDLYTLWKRVLPTVWKKYK